MISSPAEKTTIIYRTKQVEREKEEVMILLNEEKFAAVLSGREAPTTPVGSIVDQNDNWHTVWIVTDRETGEPKRAKNGALMLNHKPQRAREE